MQTNLFESTKHILIDTDHIVRPCIKLDLQNRKLYKKRLPNLGMTILDTICEHYTSLYKLELGLCEFGL